MKEELNSILPQLEEMWKRKEDRKNQFLEVIGKIQKISIEIYGTEEYDSSNAIVDDNDLTLRRLEELQKQLQSLQKEKVCMTLKNYPSFSSILGIRSKFFSRNFFVYLFIPTLSYPYRVIV